VNGRGGERERREGEIEAVPDGRGFRRRVAALGHA
jgi:hypothetical protein